MSCGFRFTNLRLWNGIYEVNSNEETVKCLEIGALICKCVHAFAVTPEEYFWKARLFTATGFGFISHFQPAVCQLRRTSVFSFSENQIPHPDCETRLFIKITHKPHY